MVFGDTGTYVSAAIEGWIPVDRPIYYSAFVSIVALFQSLYAIRLVQGALVAIVLSNALSAALGPIRPSWLVVTAAALALLTPLPWLTSWLMPDVLAGVMILAFITLAVYWHSLTRHQRIGLSTMLVFSSVVATGNLLLFALITGCFFAIQWVIERRLDKSRTGALAGVLLVSYGLAFLPNYSFHGRVALNPNSHIFLTARLLEGDLLTKYLEDTCPNQPTIPLCPYLDEVRRTNSNEFLWAADSLAARTKAWENVAQYWSMIRGAIVHSFPQFAAQGLAASWRLLLGTSLGEEGENVQPYGKESYVFKKVSLHYPSMAGIYLLARQQQGTLGVERFNSSYRGITYGSYLVLAILIWWGARQGMYRLATAGSLVFFALLLNALVFGIRQVLMCAIKCA
jgi:hypothetical protein